MNSGQKDIVITAAVRTAIGTFNGSLKNLQGHDLGSAVVKEVMKKSMDKAQKRRLCKNFNLGTGRSVKIDTLFNLIKKIMKANPRLIRKKLQKYDPKKSFGTFKKLNIFLNIKKNNFTKIEEGLVETINHLKGV